MVDKKKKKDYDDIPNPEKTRTKEPRESSPPEPEIEDEPITFEFNKESSFVVIEFKEMGNTGYNMAMLNVTDAQLSVMSVVLDEQSRIGIRMEAMENMKRQQQQMKMRKMSVPVHKKKPGIH